MVLQFCVANVLLALMSRIDPVKLCTQQMVLDEGRSCGTLLAAHFNKVAVNLKNLMHLKQHLPHRWSSAKTVKKTETQKKYWTGGK